MNDARPAVNEASLRERFELLRANFSQHDDLVRELEAFVRTTPEDRIVRINPIRYAADHGRGETEVIDLFLHARKAGLLAMEWHYVCRVCGMIAESFAALNAAGEHFFCRTCIADRDADLSDFVEIGFSVSRAVRTSRYHDPQTLSAEELFVYGTSANALVGDGTSLRDFYGRHCIFVTYVEPGETKAFRLNLEPDLSGSPTGRKCRWIPPQPIASNGWISFIATAGPRKRRSWWRRGRLPTA